MLDKCLNVSCGEHFRYLREGRIFNLELNSPAVGDDAGRHPRIEHFWLCGECAKRLKVVFEDGIVTTKPLHLEQPGPESDGKPVQIKPPL